MRSLPWFTLLIPPLAVLAFGGVVHDLRGVLQAVLTNWLIWLPLAGAVLISIVVLVIQRTATAGSINRLSLACSLVAGFLSLLGVGVLVIAWSVCC